MMRRGYNTKRRAQLGKYSDLGSKDSASCGGRLVQREPQRVAAPVQLADVGLDRLERIRSSAGLHG